MKIIQNIIAVALLVSAAYFGTGGVNIIKLIDFSSLLFIIVVTLSTLTLFKQGKDYFNGYRLLFGNKKLTLEELKCSENAFNLTIKLIYLTSAVSIILNFIILSTRLDDPSAVGPSIYSSVLTILCAALINIVNYLIKAIVIKEKISKEK
ncbi:MAG: hypothetical protein N4A47_01495 [Clostridia bacterium]|nr:hypothetical protein [Clostridia bacterium]